MTNAWDALLNLPVPVKSRRISYSGPLDAGETKSYGLGGAGCVRHWWFTYMATDAADAGQQDALRVVHNVRLQIFFDGNPAPAVDQPLDTFFGTLLDEPPIEMTSMPITVLKRNGFNAWFPMPYGAGVEFRFVNENPKRIVFWFMADVHTFAPEAQLTPLRFGSSYRKWDPSPDYGFVEMADVGGKGFIAGMFHGTDARSTTDAWYHTGGDTWLLDGERDPGVVRGNGGEDLVGYSFGIYRSHYPWQGAPFVQDASGVGGANTPCVFYRFFGPDPIVFQYSAVAKFGTKAARTETNVYAYSDGQAAPAVETVVSWRLCGPFDATSFERFDRSEFPENEAPSERTFSTDLWAWQPNPRRPGARGPYEGRWVDAPSKRGWVDVLDHFRGINYANDAAGGMGGAAYALGWLDSLVDRTVTLRIGFDDWLKLWVNDEPRGTFRHDAGFEQEAISVSLRRGRNKVLIKLSNAVNLEFYCWAFNFAVA